MKKILQMSVASIALLASPVMAADIAVRASPPPSPAPVYNWTGWYVGGNVGYGWGDAPTDVQGSATTVSFPTTIVFTNPPVAFSDSSTRRLNGFIGGGQVGYNYQVSPHWVLGFEADIQGSGERGSGNTFVNSFSTIFCVQFPAPNFCNQTVPANGTAVTTYDAKIKWFGTVRGRVGFLIDDVLVYGTGGLAYGNVKVSGNANVSGSTDESTLPGGVVTAFRPGATQFSASKTNVSFTLGAGMEGSLYWLPANWTWKLEYLYVDLGSLDTVNPFPAAVPLTGLGGALTTPFTGTITTHTHFTDNIVRVGLNYQFR